MIPNEYIKNSNPFLTEPSGLDLYEEIIGFSSFPYTETNNFFNTQFLIDKTNQDKYKFFLNNVDGILENGNQEQIVEFLSNFSQLFNIPNNKSINRSKRTIIIDQIINKLISILVKCDIFSQSYIGSVIFSCLEKIFKLYRVFDTKDSIDSLNSFLIHLFNDCPNQEILYYLLIFISSYYVYLYDQVSSVIDEFILLKLIEDDNLLLLFLPTKENEILEKNPVILIYMSFIHCEIRKDPNFSDKVQIIFDFLSNYIAQCQSLLIPIQINEDSDDYQYIDTNSISEFHNKKIEKHISLTIQAYITAISHLGNNFFDLYNHQEFPNDFLYFFNYDDDAKYTSINFIHMCCLQKIDLKEFLDHDICCSLVHLLSNCVLKMKAIEIINSLIQINNSLVSNFIDAEIEKTNVFICSQLDTESYRDLLNYIKLAQTIIHFYPLKNYIFDISEFVKYCLKVLEKGGNDLPSIIFQIFIDMINHLVKLGEPQFSLFISQFLVSDGVDITQEYIDDESVDKEICEYANSFLTLFKSNLDGEVGFGTE